MKNVARRNSCPYSLIVLLIYYHEQHRWLENRSKQNNFSLSNHFLVTTLSILRELYGSLHRATEGPTPYLSLSCFRKKRSRIKFGGCCMHATISPWSFLSKWNISLLRTGFGANTIIQVVQCTATIFVVWPSLNLHVMQWNASLKDTLKHHLTCSSGHSVGDDVAMLSQTSYIYIICICMSYSVWERDEEIKRRKVNLYLFFSVKLEKLK